MGTRYQQLQMMRDKSQPDYAENEIRIRINYMFIFSCFFLSLILHFIRNKKQITKTRNYHNNNENGLWFCKNGQIMWNESEMHDQQFISLSLSLMCVCVCVWFLFLCAEKKEEGIKNCTEKEVNLSFK